MNIRKRRRIYESDEESNLSNINSRFLQTKKRIRILELSDSTTDEDDATNFRSHYEKMIRRLGKVKGIKAKNIIQKLEILFLLRNSKIRIANVRNCARSVLQRVIEYHFSICFGKWRISTNKIHSCVHLLSVCQ